MEVEWIRLDAKGQVNVVEVMERLQSEEFASVAQNVGVPRDFADEFGYVGWRRVRPSLKSAVWSLETQKRPASSGSLEK